MGFFLWPCSISANDNLPSWSSSCYAHYLLSYCSSCSCWHRPAFKEADGVLPLQSWGLFLYNFPMKQPPLITFLPRHCGLLELPMELTFSVHMISDIPISSSKAWYTAGTSCSCLRTTTLCNFVVIFIAVPFWLIGSSLSQGVYHQLRWLQVICFPEFGN